MRCRNILNDNVDESRVRIYFNLPKFLIYSEVIFRISPFNIFNIFTANIYLKGMMCDELTCLHQGNYDLQFSADSTELQLPRISPLSVLPFFSSVLLVILILFFC